ncbi:MAG: hypothetical protein GTO53_08065 [Planctomycetales bacterium]|nr:hypothetical protein [Planctomycetales bacterium]NIN08546.1 hypothetical protein [Planctomycetales bacterium]NIN77680.1 hypothetical protein [Planctomycetales bacterium]NIO46648.1 hypothetical protein [Planctomycetales bacterium]NIP04724.1 hypothetical protein [Planctomycetales bacterium]
MKRLVPGLLSSLFATGLVLCGDSQTCQAIPPFKTEFFEVYVKENPSTPEETALAEAADAKTGKCWICHVNMKDRGESKLGKKVRNNYGKALSQFLNKDDFGSERRKAEPEKVKTQIREAFTKVEALKSDPNDPQSMTYGELIASGKLPGNDEPDKADLEAAIKERDAD